MKAWPPPAALKLSGQPLFDAATDPLARYRIIGGALALLALCLGADQLWVNWKAPSCRDFIAFWGAARLALAGTPGLAYDPAILHHLQTGFATFGNGKSMPFPYMPAFLLLVMPFGLFPYPAAMALWVVVTLSLYVLALRRLVPRAGLLALAFPPVLVDIIVGQNGFLTAALFLAAMSCLKPRPFIAGVLIGCLIFKPQLGLLFPVALLASRQWRAIAGAAASSIAITLAGALALGPATFLAWLQELPFFEAIAKDGTVGWLQLTSVYSAARQAGLGATPALALHMMILIAAATAVWKVWRSNEDMLAKASVLACATILASTYVFLYDEVLLVLPLLWLALQKTHPATIAVLWSLPVISIAQHAGYTGPINFGFVFPLALLVMVLRNIRSTGAAQSRGFDSVFPAATVSRR